MSEEIDLQVYIAALRKRWWVVLLCVVLALAISVGLSMAQPRLYQASSTLLVQSPRYQWRFDASILPIFDARRDYQREMLAIGRSNQVAQQAAEALQSSGQIADITPGALLAAINLRAGDGNTIVVTATARDPQEAAAMANAYSAAFVDLSREVYGVAEDLANFQVELDATWQHLQDLEEQLVEVRTRTGLYAAGDLPDDIDAFSTNQAQLSLKIQELAQYRNDLESLRYLQVVLAQVPPGADLAALPWELLAGPVIAARGVVTPEIARAGLDDPAGLLALLQEEEGSLATTAQQLAGEVEQLQAALAVDWQAYAQVNRERNLVKETYNLLSRKVAEAAMQQRVDPGLLTWVSEAVPPPAPVRTRQLAQVATAGAIGLIVGVLLALWLELGPRRGGRTSPQPEPPKTSQ